LAHSESKSSTAQRVARVLTAGWGKFSTLASLLNYANFIFTRAIRWEPSITAIWHAQLLSTLQNFRDKLPYSFS
jgi:hypothetical protein